MCETMWIQFIVNGEMNLRERGRGHTEGAKGRQEEGQKHRMMEAQYLISQNNKNKFKKLQVICTEGDF